MTQEERSSTFISNFILEKKRKQLEQYPEEIVYYLENFHLETSPTDHED
jgi:hypothetical protein